MPTTPCLTCGLPRAVDLVGVVPCPICGADGLPPVAEEIPDTPPTVAVVISSPEPPRPVPGGSYFVIGLSLGLLIGAAAGAGGVLGWQSRPVPPTEPEVTAAPASIDPPPLPPPPSPKTPDPLPPTVDPLPSFPQPKEKPNPFRPTGPPSLVLDNPDGETRPVVRPGGHLVLTGKVKRLVIPGLLAGAVLDASRLEAGDVVVAGPIDGGSRIVVCAPGGVVRFRGRVDGESVVEVTARSVAFDEAISGAGTRVRVTLTSGGELAFSTVTGGSRLEYRKANPGDPVPKLTAGLVTAPGVLTQIP
jgi:hypothetical protein